MYLEIYIMSQHHAYVVLSYDDKTFTNLAVNIIDGEIADHIVFDKMKMEIFNPENCTTLKIPVPESLFHMMNTETTILDENGHSDDINDITLEKFIMEIIIQLGGEVNDLTEWVIEITRIKL